MTRVNTQMNRWSWGEFEFEWRIVGPFTADYTTSNCDNSIGNSAPAKNILGKAAAERAGIDVNSFDFQMYWHPNCQRSSGGWRGIAYIGATGGVMYGGGSVDGTAGTLAHEFGHNCKPAMPACMALVTLRAFYLSCNF